MAARGLLEVSGVSRSQGWNPTMSSVHGCRAASLSVRVTFLAGIATAGLGGCWGPESGSSADSSLVEWPVTGGDLQGTGFSPLADLKPSTVDRLRRAWEWRSNEQSITDTLGRDPPQQGWFEATPVMIGDTLYFPTPLNRVVALDAETGTELWRFDPGVWRWPVAGNQGFVHRGIAVWSGPSERRVFINAGWRLFALDAATGRPVPSFGDSGQVDLTAGLPWPVLREHYRNTSPPVVFESLVIIGSSVDDQLIYDRDPPGDVQAFDVRTGRRVWSWSPVPRQGGPGAETWEEDSAERTGHVNVWAAMTVDTARGLLFLPVSTPSNDFYGGARLGDNLFAESVVCLDARTGTRRWHFQIVHHGLWDYDPAAAPVLVTLERDGRPVDAVVLAGKTGFLYIFERETGRPVWPIEERPVPASDVPGERAAPTQPFPTWPLPFARQGLTGEDLVDFTPALRRQAEAVLARHRGGPIFTPPSLEGTLMLPGIRGGAGWGSVAFDPSTRILYVKASNVVTMAKLVPDTEADRGPRFRNDASAMGTSVDISLDDSTSIPIVKPPYGTLTAIDMDSGEHLWQVPFGDTPRVRTHPALGGIDPGPLGQAGPVGPIVTAGGLLFGTGGGSVLYALDAKTGAVLIRRQLRSVARSVPMTYRTSRGTQFVVVAVGRQEPHLVAFAQPEPRVPGDPR